MRKTNIGITVEVYDSLDELPEHDRELVEKAKESSDTAYAPYSHFRVGAALRLDDGKIISGNNQENVAYPSGMCAERVAMYYAGSQFPGAIIDTIAIAAGADEFAVSEVAPCGACRQAMAEYQLKQSRPIRVIMKGEKGKIQAVNSIEDLLPLMFHAEELKKKK